MEYDEENFAKYFLPDGIADEVPIQRNNQQQAYKPYQSNRNTLLSTLGGTVHQPSNANFTKTNSTIHSQIGQFRSSPGTIGSKGPPPGLSAPTELNYHNSGRRVQHQFNEEHTPRQYPPAQQYPGYNRNEHVSPSLRPYQTHIDPELSTFRLVHNDPYQLQKISPKINNSGVIGPPKMSAVNREQRIHTNQYPTSSNLSFTPNSPGTHSQLHELNSSSSIVRNNKTVQSTSSVIGTQKPKPMDTRPQAQPRNHNIDRVNSPCNGRRASFPQSKDAQCLNSPEKKVWTRVNSPKQSSALNDQKVTPNSHPIMDKSEKRNITSQSIKTKPEPFDKFDSKKVYQPVKENHEKVALTSQNGNVEEHNGRKCDSTSVQRKPPKDPKVKREKEIKKEKPKVKKERKLERCHSSPPRTSTVMTTPKSPPQEIVPSVFDKLLMLLQSLPVFQAFYQRYFGSTSFSEVITNGMSNANSAMMYLLSYVTYIFIGGFKGFLQVHRYSFNVLLMNHHIAFSFTFLYAFPYLVQYIIPWAPPWAPVCLWYAFLVQLFCTNGPGAMVSFFRLILPLVFLLEGVSHHSFLLDLNGAELLLISFILSALKTRNVCSPIFFLSVAAQCLSSVFLGSHLAIQWGQLTLALFSLHNLTIPEDEWQTAGSEMKRKTMNYVQMPQYSPMSDSAANSTSRRIKRPDRRRKVR